MENVKNGNSLEILKLGDEEESKSLMALNSLSIGTSLGKERHYPENTIEKILGSPECTLQQGKKVTADFYEKSEAF